MLKPSRRAAVIAASFALGLSAVGPTAHAGLLGGSDSDSVGLPVGGDLLGGDLLGGLLGENGLLGGDLLGSVLGGDLLGGDLLGSVLGGGGGLPVVSALSGGGGLPLVGDVLGGGLPLGSVLGGEGVLGGELLGGELLNVVTDTTLHCDAAIPQVLWTLLGDVTEAVCAPFSNGLLGLLSSL